MGYSILDDCFKPFCYDALLCELKIESLGDEMTLIYKGHTFDDMVKAINENKDLKREIELLQGQVSYYEDKLEERSYEGEALDDLEKEYAVLKKDYDSIIDDVTFWKGKYEEACREAKKYIKQNESLRKENASLQANIDILNKNIRLQEVERRDTLIDGILDLIYDFYEDVRVY